MSLFFRISRKLHEYCSKCRIACITASALFLIFVAVLVPYSPICNSQLTTWHTIFLGYVGIASIISAFIVINMEHIRSSDYKRETLLFTYNKRIKLLVRCLLLTFISTMLLLTINACTPLPFIILIYSVLSMIPTFYIMYMYVEDIYTARRDSKKFIDKVNSRLTGILRKDVNTSQNEGAKEEDYEYPKEISNVTSVILDDIVNQRSSHADKGLRWLQEILINLILKTLSVSEIIKLSAITNTARDSYAKMLIEASASNNRGLLNSVLIQTELSSQHFIKTGLSTSFHSLLDAYQLAMKEQTDSAIIEQYASCFDAFGNLKAAISVLDDNGEKLRFKLAVLNTTLVLICYSFSSRELGASVIGLFQTLLRLDEDLTCSDSDDDKDYTGFGCWIFVNAILLRIILSAPESELRNQASALYASMHHELNNEKLPLRFICESVKYLNMHWSIIRKSSTGDSLNFCLRLYYPGFIEQMMQGYIIKAVFLLALTSLEGIWSESCRVVEKLIEMNDMSYKNGDFKAIVKEAKKVNLFRDYNENVLQEIEEFISKRNEK